MSEFAFVNGKGGYIGCFYWRNSGEHDGLPYWGEFCILPRNILNVAWAGSLWAVRVLIHGVN